MSEVAYDEEESKEKLVLRGKRKKEGIGVQGTVEGIGGKLL